MSSYYSYRSSRHSSTATRQRRASNGQRRGARVGQYIDPARFVKVASVTEADVYVPKHKFSDFKLHPTLQTNLTTKGYEIPSPIQDQTIPAALEGKNIIGIANTGTGKTAAFALPVLNCLISKPGSRAIIIAPTRELAQQIEVECRALGRGTGLMGAVLIGGTPMGPQLSNLRKRPEIVIGTPGRIKDHLERGSLDLSRFNLVVLDEVDRMLDMGFVQDVTHILKSVASENQSFFFSATMDPKVRALINGFAENPVVISHKASAASESVHQDVVHYRGNINKIDKLHDILIKPEVSKVIVFDETQRSVERLSNELVARGFAADAIHGGKSQGQRQRALRRFKESEIKILVATDVAARGIDVADITHVINYSVPKAFDDYIHRIGRAGRAGQVGYALTFLTD